MAGRCNVGEPKFDLGVCMKHWYYMVSIILSTSAFLAPYLAAQLLPESPNPCSYSSPGDFSPVRLGAIISSKPSSLPALQR